MPATPRRRRTAAWPLADRPLPAALAAVGLALAPAAPACANDRDPRGTPVPARARRARAL